MRILFFFLVAGWLGLFVLCLRGKPHTLPEVFSALGGFLPRRFVRKRAGRTRGEMAVTLFPEQDPESAARLYVRFWWGLWYCGLIICCSLCLGAFWYGEQAAQRPQPEISLERPAFGAEDQSVLLEVAAEEGAEVVTDRVQVRIPARAPDAADVERLLDEAEQKVRRYFEARYLHTETWPEDIEEVQIFCTPAEDRWIDAQGTVLWEQIQVPVDTRIQVLLTAYGQERTCLVDLHLDPRQETLQEKTEHMLDRLEQGAYVAEDRVLLPTEDEQGVRYTWNPVQKQRTGPEEYVVLALLLPVLPPALYRHRIRQKAVERRKLIYRSYPDMLNRFMILLGAGMSMMRVWEKMDADYRAKKKKDHKTDPLLEEMLRVENRIRTGYSFAEALRIMAESLKIREIRQFAAILSASWKRGDEHVLLHLQELHDRSWDIRKNQARKASEEADTKLLLPLMMMLIVVIIIVLSPALMTMTV